MEVIDKNEYVSKIEVVRILQKAYAEGRVKANDGLVSVLDDINAADVQPVDRWIIFKDKQPQEGGFYLTYYAEHIHVSQWFTSKNWYNEHGGNVSSMVEYWQPLPKPPETR
ncbi:DUF551 domain-containing protein [Ruminococcus sp.]|uniref:DUF551 domain-containing protein n=1 Tax=Ruminococcus sp. TaxID=41978 RepID=UPI001B6CF1CC|nr:DUF551 domain-containing protein [Ruminococcus sp.]MBP5433638.1 hypothetical protein [Ruminococcus sp.]